MLRALEESYKVAGAVLFVVGGVLCLVAPTLGLPILVVGILAGLAGRSRERARQHAELMERITHGAGH